MDILWWGFFKLLLLGQIQEGISLLLLKGTWRIFPPPTSMTMVLNMLSEYLCLVRFPAGCLSGTKKKRKDLAFGWNSDWRKNKLNLLYWNVPAATERGGGNVWMEMVPKTCSGFTHYTEMRLLCMYLHTYYTAVRFCRFRWCLWVIFKSCFQADATCYIKH